MRPESRNLSGDDVFSVVFKAMPNMLADAVAGDSDESRKVARYRPDDNSFIVDTCLVRDTGYYETAICHDNIHEGRWVIVTQYENEEQAVVGHNKWVKYMLEEKPTSLYDIYLEEELT